MRLGKFTFVLLKQLAWNSAASHQIMELCSTCISLTQFVGLYLNENKIFPTKAKECTQLYAVCLEYHLLRRSEM